MRLPPLIKQKSGRENYGKRSPAHRKWVARHACSACGSRAGIECAHVRTGTGGGVGMKPSDRWTISLCRDCHAEQHRIGERAFEHRYKIDMKALAEAFAEASPHRLKLKDMA